jgi:hypothetical protein
MASIRSFTRSALAALRDALAGIGNALAYASPSFVAFAARERREGREVRAPFGYVPVRGYSPVREARRICRNAVAK